MTTPWALMLSYEKPTLVVTHFVFNCWLRLSTTNSPGTEYKLWFEQMNVPGRLCFSIHKVSVRSRQGEFTSQ